MENKNKKKPKLTVKNINTTFGAIIFVLVFLFTFLVTSNELREKWVILIAVFGSLVGAAGIAWLTTYLVFKKKQEKADPNKQKINQALEELKKEQEKKELEK